MENVSKKHNGAISQGRNDDRINTVVSDKKESTLLHVEFEYDIGVIENNKGYADYSRLANANIQESSDSLIKGYEGKLQLTLEGHDLAKEEQDRSFLTKMLSGNWDDKLYTFGGFPLRNGLYESNPIATSDQLDLAEEAAENNLHSIVNNIADELNYETNFENY